LITGVIKEETDNLSQPCKELLAHEEQERNYEVKTYQGYPRSRNPNTHQDGQLPSQFGHQDQQTRASSFTEEQVPSRPGAKVIKLFKA
jgi:hypothetical protein